jgi:hypothetical protein
VKRLSLFLLALLLLVMAACGPSPRARSSEFVKYLPAKIGDWKQDDKATVELLNSTVTSKGHVTLQYEGPDKAIGFIVVEAHPSEDAAQVAISDRQRELLMLGLTFSADRKAKNVTAQVAQNGAARYALLQDSEIMVEIDVLAASADTPVSDEAFGQLLEAVRAAFAKESEKNG